MIPTIEQIELAIMQWASFDFRKNLIVFRASDFSGVVNHECDCLIMSKTGYLTEIEIKRSYTDFLSDFKKKHTHNDPKIKDFFFMVHNSFLDKVVKKLVELKRVPSGIYSYDDDCKITYECSSSDILKEIGSDDNIMKYYNGSNARKLFLEEQYQLARLGAMRYMNMTKKLILIK